MSYDRQNRQTDNIHLRTYLRPYFMRQLHYPTSRLYFASRDDRFLGGLRQYDKQDDRK
jgi:hypothetical protein